MEKTARVAGGTLTLLSAIFVAVIVWGWNTCNVSLEGSDALVNRYLDQAGLDKRFLSSGSLSPNSCRADYSYNGVVRKLEFSVIDDPMHGQKLTIWDHARDASGR